MLETASISIDFFTGALAKLDDTVHVHAAEISELRASGVSQARISALYPFDPLNYRAGLQMLCSSAQATRRVLNGFKQVDLYADLPALAGNWADADTFGGLDVRDAAWDLVVRTRFELAQQRSQYLGFAGSLYMLPALLNLLPQKFTGPSWAENARLHRVAERLPLYAACTQSLLSALGRSK